MLTKFFFKIGRHAMILILMLVFITNTLVFLVALLKLPGFMLSYPILHYHIDFYANFNFKVSSQMKKSSIFISTMNFLSNPYYQHDFVKTFYILSFIIQNNYPSEDFTWSKKKMNSRKFKARNIVALILLLCLI